MAISGKTRVFMIIGDPVAQVRAPEVYNQLFATHGIDAVLVPVKVSAAQLAGFVRNAFAAENFGGFWVTIPHKAAMQALMQECDPVAEVAGAVNAVRRKANGATEGALEGALFDGLGFIKGLDHFGIAVQGRRVLVLGAGGGGQAVAAALAQRSPSSLVIANRSIDKAQAIVDRLQPRFEVPVSCTTSTDPAGFDVIVNCTSQGLKAGDALPTDPARIDAGAAVVDIIMTKEPTPLLAACRARGLHAHAGFEMLVQQVPEYMRFFGMPELAATLQQDLTEVRQMLYPK
ncbi:shikimate dehydrogenase [Rhodoferax lacus]|uniref:shikimate dehydrogenase (NADP(+)) n=1 Tax=Rhodoferax lacus TaxID=2184758 RepID=A0A3E1RDZ7_9BURK|nr:saccharopine dehydrogenase NADP-binding domain-containing protein [Rhodoferax lacus]RFO97242.1 shikimate dehydrogenase [Rhodoferax lacus]